MVPIALTAIVYCESRSDGPDLQYDSDDNPVLVGIWTLGFQCGENNTPTVQLRLGDLHSFLPPEVERTTDVVQIYNSSSVPRKSRLSVEVIVGLTCGALAFIFALIMCFVLVKYCWRGSMLDMRALENVLEDETVRYEHIEDGYWSGSSDPADKRRALHSDPNGSTMPVEPAEGSG